MWNGMNQPNKANNQNDNIMNINMNDNLYPNSATYTNKYIMSLDDTDVSGTSGVNANTHINSTMSANGSMHSSSYASLNANLIQTSASYATSNPSQTTATYAAPSPSQTSVSYAAPSPSQTTATYAAQSPSQTTATYAAPSPSQTTATYAAPNPSQTTATYVAPNPSQTTATYAAPSPSQTTATYAAPNPIPTSSTYATINPSQNLESYGNSQNDVIHKKPIIEFKKVFKEYKNGMSVTNALNGIDLTIYEGEIVIFLGTSGAGKSTALNVLGGLDRVTSGEIIVNDCDITKFNESKLLKYRRNDIGFIFQFYNLVQTLTAKDNVELVLELVGKDKDEAVRLLELVGLGERINNFPSQLSGGEQQRISIARALAKKPKILLADEPTGALDYNTTRQVLELLVKVCREEKITLIIVTHNNFIVPIADVVYSFRSGEIISAVRNNAPTKVEDLGW